LLVGLVSHLFGFNYEIIIAFLPGRFVIVYKRKSNKMKQISWGYLLPPSLFNILANHGCYSCVTLR